MFSVVTANANGIRAAQRRGGLAWLAELDADVLCLQEVRCTADQLTDVLSSSELAAWHASYAPGQVAGRAGVAVLTRQQPVATRVGLEGFADQGRWIEVDVAGPGRPITVVSTYVHTGEADTPRQDEKYAFLRAMTARMSALAAVDAAGTGYGLITGDLNVAHRQEDLKNWKGNLNKAGFLLGEREIFDGWFDTGWVDLGRRHAGPGPGPYTWWSWRGKAFDLDSGWRIDYQLATPALAERAVKVEIGRAATYAQRWSDHAAVTVWFD